MYKYKTFVCFGWAKVLFNLLCKFQLILSPLSFRFKCIANTANSTTLMKIFSWSTTFFITEEQTSCPSIQSKYLEVKLSQKAAQRHFKILACTQSITLLNISISYTLLWSICGLMDYEIRGKTLFFLEDSHIHNFKNVLITLSTKHQDMMGSQVESQSLFTPMLHVVHVEKVT